MQDQEGTLALLLVIIRLERLVSIKTKLSAQGGQSRHIFVGSRKSDFGTFLPLTLFKRSASGAAFFKVLEKALR